MPSGPIPRVPPRLLHGSITAMRAKRFVDWSFRHYLNIAPPAFAERGSVTGWLTTSMLLRSGSRT